MDRLRLMVRHPALSVMGAVALAGVCIGGVITFVG